MSARAANPSPTGTEESVPLAEATEEALDEGAVYDPYGLGETPAGLFD